MTVNLLIDIIAVLDADDAALTAEAAAVQAQIDDLMAQLAAIAQTQANSARFRTLVQSIQDGSAFSSVVVPGAPAPMGTPTPVTPGITGV